MSSTITPSVNLNALLDMQMEKQSLEKTDTFDAVETNTVHHIRNRDYNRSFWRTATCNRRFEIICT